MVNVNYISALGDSSGYAEAARNYVAALHTVGVNVNPVPISFERFRSDLGKLGEMVRKIKNPPGKIQIIHTTPTIFNKFIKADKYNIGYTVWETSRLPKPWVREINLLDEVWVPCEQNVQCFRESGVDIPIYRIPHCFEPGYSTEAGDVSHISNVEQDDFLFYSIFQWTERKNPEGLLKAFLTEFHREEKVTLLLKSYIVDPTNPQERESLKRDIGNIKAKLHLKEFPRILLISSILSRQQIQALHQRGDCFISLNKCEGFGIPIAEAMISGNPVITTGYGGAADFVKHEETGYLTRFQMTPVYGMPWETYSGDQNWAEPNLMDARHWMRHLFDNRSVAKQVGEKAKTLANELSWENVGNLMKARLLEIEKVI